jgi:hypothetical protein
LENRRRVEIWHNEPGKTFSNQETIKTGGPQGSILGPLLFLLYINDLTLGIKIDSKLLLYADDTSVLIFGTSIQEVQTKCIMALDTINKCFTRNGLSLRLKQLK